MALLTGKQVFEQLILPLIDNTVTVETIILNSDPEFNFKVCDVKWMKAGQSFQDSDGFFWGIGSIDVENKIVYANRPSALANLEYGDTILIHPPSFRSGTPMSVDGEEKSRIQADQVTITPIIWLLESISGERKEFGMPQDETFDFTFFCLESYSFANHKNDDRHREGIFPMKQLGNEVINGIDNTIGMERIGKVQQMELSRFGRESEKGFEKYILDLDLSGMRYKMKVLVDEIKMCC